MDIAAAMRRLTGRKSMQRVFQKADDFDLLPTLINVFDLIYIF